MRKVVSGLFVSLDGVTESPDQWQFDHFDEGMMAAMKSTLDAADAVLMGRVTYQEWAPYWPTATDEPFASFINRAPKFVVSTTLDQVRWGKFENIALIKGWGAHRRARHAEAQSRQRHRRGRQPDARSLPASERHPRRAHAD